ncbi:MAG: hypothetical protein RLZZ15_1044 [Verrucomicrobiota bacterium]|jgi:hypothetical protein
MIGVAGGGAARRLRRVSPRKLRVISALVLASGLGAATAIYFFAPPTAVDPLTGDQLDRKKFRHELRVMGGNANVVAAEFMDWFAGLWQGRSLAATVAVLTVAGTLALRFVALRPELWAPIAAEKISPPGPGAAPR